MRWPRFKIIGFSDELDEQQIAHSILEQNEIAGDRNDVKITFIRKSKKDKKLSTIFGECAPNIFGRLMALKKININWQRYSIYEVLDVVRCFKCQRHYHKLDKCPYRLTCEHCSGDHHVRDCPKNFKKCINCTTANEKYHLNYNIDHEANDPECPSYKYLLNVLRGKIDYGNGNG